MASSLETTELISEAQRERLRRIVEAFANGAGPVEEEALRRLGLTEASPGDDFEDFARSVYPADVRELLNHMGYERLYLEDIARARALYNSFTGSTGKRLKPAQTGAKGQAPAQVALLLLAFAILGGIIWYLAQGAYSHQADSLARARAAPATTEARLVKRNPEHLECRSRTRAQAVVWCANAFGGAPLGKLGGPFQPKPADSTCGDPLIINNKTVRIAQDELFDRGQASTYAVSDVPAFCMAAAEVALPR